MKTSRFSKTRMVEILKQANVGIKVKICVVRIRSVIATYDNWNATYGGLEVSDHKRLKETES